jgi:hypothetical protein
MSEPTRREERERIIRYLDEKGPFEVSLIKIDDLIRRLIADVDRLEVRNRKLIEAIRTAASQLSDAANRQAAR